MKYRLISRASYSSLRRYSCKGLSSSNVYFRKFLTRKCQQGFYSSNDFRTGTYKNYNSFKIIQKQREVSALYQQTKMKLRDWATFAWRVLRASNRSREQNLMNNRPPLQAGLAPKLSLNPKEVTHSIKKEATEKSKVIDASALYPNETVEFELQAKLHSPQYEPSEKRQEQDYLKVSNNRTQSSRRVVSMVDGVRIYAMQIPQLISGIVSTFGWSQQVTQTKHKPLQTSTRSVKSEIDTVVTPKPEPSPTPKLEPISPKKEVVKDKQPLWKRAQRPWVTGEVCVSRTRYLMRAIVTAATPVGQVTRIEDFCQHLIDNPQAKSVAVKERGISMLLRVRAVTQENEVKARVNEALALLGHINPLPARGIRILSIDGGGTRGVMALEILRTFERMTNQPVHRLFDFICGVSTGAILSVLLGPMKASMDECEELYKRTSCEIFNQNTWLGTGKLVFNHAFYDTNSWVKILKKNIGECPLYQTARDADCPKLATVSTIVNEPRLRAFLFRNYDYPYRHQSLFPGSYCPQLWEAVRASAAAPGYFEEYKLGDYVHQDGGILTNNPSALAIHECRHLWPGEHIQCVISLGNGRHEPQLPVTSNVTTSSLKTKLLKIVDSATDTEGVHMILNDLLPPKRYYRFNPYLSDAFSLDEVRPEKFKILQNDAAMYIRKNEHKIREAAVQLLEPKTQFQKMRDNIKEKVMTYL